MSTGTPLFSEEAILAAAAPAPEAPTEPEVPIEAVEATAPVAASIEDAETVVPVPSVRDDLSAHVAVWSVALMEWSTGSRAIDVPPQHVGSPPPSVPESIRTARLERLNLRPEHAPPLSAGPVWTPSGELPMDATPEPRHHEPPALDHTAASSTVEAKNHRRRPRRQ